MIFYLIRFRDIFAGLFFVVMVFSISYFGIYRFLEQNRNTLNAIQEAILDRKIREEQILQIPDMERDAEFIDENNTVSPVFISKDEVVPLAERVELLGSRFGVTVVLEAASDLRNSTGVASGEALSDEQGSPVKESSYSDSIVPLLPEERSIFIDFKVTGRYENILFFLEKLDSFPVLLDVLSIDMIPQAEDESVRRSEETLRPTLIFGDSEKDLPLKSNQLDIENISEERKKVQATFSAVLYLRH